MTTETPTPCRPPETLYELLSNLPPACSSVMMTSAAERFSSLCRSTGMPRPLSSTVTELSVWIVTRTLFGVAGQRLVDGVVDDFVDHVMQAGDVIGVADVHARALADGVEAFENFDVFGGVVAGDRRRLRA